MAIVEVGVPQNCPKDKFVKTIIKNKAAVSFTVFKNDPFAFEFEKFSLELKLIVFIIHNFKR